MKAQDGKYIVKVDAKRLRITLPLALSEKYKMVRGSVLLIEDVGDGIKISPADIVKKTISIA